jgi:hypothetical protein
MICFWALQRVEGNPVSEYFNRWRTVNQLMKTWQMAGGMFYA